MCLVSAKLRPPMQAVRADREAREPTAPGRGRPCGCGGRTQACHSRQQQPLPWHQHTGKQGAGTIVVVTIVQSYMLFKINSSEKILVIKYCNFFFDFLTKFHDLYYVVM